MRSIFTTPEGSRGMTKLLENYTLENMALVISNTEEGIKKLQQYVQLGFTEIMVVNSSPDRKKLVKLLAQQISPAFKAEQ
jgi:coenzyme F420-dependent glucose-6-phosphate dehydrogenase